MTCHLEECPGKFRSKVVEVEAHPYDGTPESAAAVLAWSGKEVEGLPFSLLGGWIVCEGGVYSFWDNDAFEARFEEVK